MYQKRYMSSNGVVYDEIQQHMLEFINWEVIAKQQRYGSIDDAADELLRQQFQQEKIQEQDKLALQRPLARMPPPVAQAQAPPQPVPPKLPSTLPLQRSLFRRHRYRNRSPRRSNWYRLRSHLDTRHRQRSYWDHIRLR